MKYITDKMVKEYQSEGVRVLNHIYHSPEKAAQGVNKWTIKKTTSLRESSRL